MRINIAGDFVITEKYLQEDLFSSSIRQFFSKDSINIVNLEYPIIEDNFRPIVKSGPNLFTKKKLLII